MLELELQVIQFVGIPTASAHCPCTTLSSIATIMAPAVTRAIRWLSTLQGQSSTQKANSIARMTVFSKEHFPKFLGLVGVSGFVSGFYLQQSLHNKKVCAAMMLIRFR